MIPYLSTVEHRAAVRAVRDGERRVLSLARALRYFHFCLAEHASGLLKETLFIIKK